MKNIELIDKAIDELINWPSNEPEETHLYQFNSGRFVAGISGGSTPAPFCTRAEFEARKAERQNKPDWGDHFYKFIQQGKNGHWYGSVKDNPPPLPDVITNDDWECITYFGRQGELIGSHSETMEQRPAAANTMGEAISIAMTNAANKMATDLRDLANAQAPEFKHGAGVLNLVDDDWHARGELPPVSTQCEWKGLNGGYWVQCEVIDKYQDKEMVVFNTGEYRNCRYEILKLDSVEFRPLRTEREKFVEAAIRVGELRARDGAVEVYGRLFDAGFRAPESK